MFWKSHVTQSASVDELLSKENVTLEQLLDEEDIIQECKTQNSQVIDFLTQPEMMMSLVSHMVTEPDPSGDLAAQYRYANMASEIVSCNIPAIIDQLASERPLLQRLYSLLERDAPLNPLLASFFSRTLALLIVRRPDQSWYSYQFNCLQVLEFLKSMETFIDLVLRHLGTSAVMDLTCNLISGIEAPEYRQNALNWLNDQRLVQRLAGLMADSEHPERQANAGQVVISVVTCARQMAQQLPPGEKEPNPLVSSIETVEFVSTVLDGVLGPGRTESGLVNAVDVLRLLLDTGHQGAPYSQNEADEESPPEEPASVQAVTEAVLPRLADLHQVLVAPPPRPDIRTTCGRLSPPLGATRLQLARLTAALLAANRPAVNAELARLGTVDLLLDLFFQYSLNNFLHSQVEQCISWILEAEPQENDDGKTCHPLLVHIFTKTKLVQRILQGMEEPQTNGETAEQKRCCRSLRAYCGHLVNMANKICSACEEGPNSELVRQQLDALPESTRISWQAFKEAKLNRINEQNKPVLPDTKQDSSCDSDYRGVTDAQQAAMLRTFHNFQLLNSSSGAGVPDQIGHSDDEYNDIGDALSAPLEQLTPVGLLALDVSSDQRPSAAELFTQQCAERFSKPDEADTWASRRAASLERCHSSSDEEDGDEPEPGDETSPGLIQMEVDTSDPWADSAAAAHPVAMDTALWEAAPEAAAAGSGWADFTAFQSPADGPAAAAQQPDVSRGDGDSRASAAPAAAEPLPGFHTNFEAAFSHTCALQEGKLPVPPEGQQQPEQQQQQQQQQKEQQLEQQEQRQQHQKQQQQQQQQQGAMEVQPEMLVAHPVKPRADASHELSATGGGGAPPFHVSSTEPDEESPLGDPARLAENYSYLTSKGLMNGAAEPSATGLEQLAAEPASPAKAAEASAVQQASHNGPI